MLLSAIRRKQYFWTHHVRRSGRGIVLIGAAPENTHRNEAERLRLRVPLAPAPIQIPRVVLQKKPPLRTAFSFWKRERVLTEKRGGLLTNRDQTTELFSNTAL